MLLTSDKKNKILKLDNNMKNKDTIKKLGYKIRILRKEKKYSQ